MNIEKLIEIIKSYEFLEIGWDGYSGEPPSRNSIIDAIIFIDYNLKEISLPSPMCGGDIVSIFWENSNGYLEIDFEGDGKYSYLLINNFNKDKNYIFENYDIPLNFIPDHIKIFLNKVN